MRRLLFLLPALSLLLVPAQSLAHQGSIHAKPKAMPKLTLLTGEQKLLPTDLAWRGAGAIMAVKDSEGDLRIAIKRTRKGISGYQEVGSSKLKLPLGSVALSKGIKDGIRLELSKDGQISQRVSLPWCPSGTAPMAEGNRPSPGNFFYQSCGESVSLFIESGIDSGWFGTLDAELMTSESPTDSSSQLRQGPLYLPEVGDYKLKVTVDPKRILHVAQGSTTSHSFDLKVTQAMRDQLLPPEEPVEPVLEAASAPVLPDLKVMPATRLSIAGYGFGDQIPELLRFDSLVWNNSAGRLVVRARRSSSSSKTMAAYQTITNQSGHPKKTVRIGKLVWSSKDGHNHWHYDGLAHYRILNSSGKTVADSGKIGFCFVNTTPVDSRLFPSYDTENQDYGNLGCGYRWSLAVSMELDGGWGDTYSQDVAGQAFDISNLPNGSYSLQVKANDGPYAKIREKNYSNNTSSRKFSLSGPAGERDLQVEEWLGDPGLN